MVVNGREGIFSKSTKCVFVELINVSINTSYDIVLQNEVREKNKRTDLEKIAQVLQQKSKALSSVFVSSDNYLFQKLSEVRPNTWIKIGNNSPVKDKSEIRCVVVKTTSFELLLDQDNPNSCSVINSTAMVQHVPLPNFSISSDEESSPSNSLRPATYQQQIPLSDISDIESDSETQQFDDSDGQRIFTQVFPIVDRQGREYVRLNSATYKLPTFFGTQLTEKINDTNQSLTSKDYLAINRILANSFEEHTLHPHPDSIRFVVDRMLSKYPNLILDKEDSIATNGVFYYKTQASNALEILPLLIPVKNRKGVVAVNYLYYVKEESVSLEAVLKETLNRPPFILNMGDSFHIIVENQVLLAFISLCDSLLNMFAAYYVFSIAHLAPKLNMLCYSFKV